MAVMADRYTDMLRGAGLRVTAARLAVLRVIDELEHSDADQIRTEVRDRLGSISGQAIYDAVNTLTTRGVLRRFEPAGCRARYEINRGDNHHHAVCTRCGRVVDVECAVGAAPCLQAQDIAQTWRIQQAEVIYWGLCPDCVAAEAETSGVEPTPTAAGA